MSIVVRKEDEEKEPAETIRIPKPSTDVAKWSWELLDPAKAPRFCIFGRTGSGKTVFAKEMIQYYVRHGWRCIVIDTKQEFADIPAFSPAVFKSPQGWARRISEIRVGHSIIDYPHILAEFMAEFAWHFKKIFLYVEELGNAIPKHAELYRSSPFIAKLLFQGRAFDRGILIVSQQPSITHLDFIKQADDLFIFRCNDVEGEALPKYIGSRIRMDLIPDFGFWTLGTGCIHEAVKISKKVNYG